MEAEIRTCETCRAKVVFAPCLGCGAGVCETCALFELIGSGCGCVMAGLLLPEMRLGPDGEPERRLSRPAGRTRIGHLEMTISF